MFETRLEQLATDMVGGRVMLVYKELDSKLGVLAKLPGVGHVLIINQKLVVHEHQAAVVVHELAHMIKHNGKHNENWMAKVTRLEKVLAKSLELDLKEMIDFRLANNGEWSEGV